MPFVDENPTTMPNQLDPETIRRYAEARKIIDENVDLICSISAVFSIFEDWGDDRVSISAFALGKLNDQMKLYACRIISALEDFLSASDAQDLLETLETKEAEREEPKANND